MGKLTPYLGSASAAFLAAGVMLWLLQPSRDRIWASFLIAGLALLVLYVGAHGQKLLRLAGRRSAREGANALVLALIATGIVVAINYIANRHSRRWDFTAARQFTLSEQTAKTVAGLDREVEVVLLDNPTSSSAIAARDLLELYDAESDRLRVSIVDPEAEPQRALAYQEPGETGIALGTVLVVSGDRKERATAATEPEITNAILRVVRTDRKKIYFTAGHEEKSIDESDPNAGISLIKERLSASTYDVAPLIIARSVVDEQMRVPEDADAVVIAGPRSDFLPEEIEALDRYLSSGGRAIFLVDPANQSQATSLAGYLREIGVELRDDVVVDPLSVPPLYPVVRSYGAHPIVESFSNALSLFPIARSVERSEDLPQGTEVRDLFSSEAESWSETRISELGSRQGPAPDQERGPLSLAVAVTMSKGTETANGETEKERESDSEADGEASSGKAGRIVVVGDSDFIANELASAPVLNSDLFINMVNWVAEDEDLISIRPREPEDRRIFLSSQQMTNVLLLSLLIIPGALLVTGLSVWWGRR